MHETCHRHPSDLRRGGDLVQWNLESRRRVDMTRAGLESFGPSLRVTDEVVTEAIANCMPVSCVLSPW